MRSTKAILLLPLENHSALRQAAVLELCRSNLAKAPELSLVLQVFLHTTCLGLVFCLLFPIPWQPEQHCCLEMTRLNAGGKSLAKMTCGVLSLLAFMKLLSFCLRSKPRLRLATHTFASELLRLTLRVYK